MRTVSASSKLYVKICFKNPSKRSLKKAKEYKQNLNGMNHLLCIMMMKSASRLQKKQMKINGPLTSGFTGSKCTCLI